MPVKCPVIVKTKHKKPSSPGPNALPGGQYHHPAIPLCTAIWGHTRGSACRDTVQLPCVSLSPEWFLHAHPEPSALMQLLFATSSGRRLLGSCASSNGHCHWASPWMYLQERVHMKQTFSFFWPHRFTSELQCCSQSLSMSWGSCMA